MYNKIINNFLNSVPKKDKKGSTKMSEVISLINEKGGVGKSTSAITIAQILAISGYQVLLIDLDPQMNTTKMFGKDEDNSNINYEHLFCEKQLRESSVLEFVFKQVCQYLFPNIFQFCLHQESSTL